MGEGPFIHWQAKGPGLQTPPFPYRAFTRQLHDHSPYAALHNYFTCTRPTYHRSMKILWS